jgi:hypothetical protein
MKGNPRQFTINQHVFPVASFRRFTNDRGLVMVRCFHRPRDLTLHPTNPMFCAQRAWDERTEKGLMRDIEDRFQALADEITGGRQVLGPTELGVVSRFYALCRVRGQHRASPTPNMRSPDIKGDALTLEQQEHLEKNGYSFMTEDGMPGRMMAGIMILREIDIFQHKLTDIPWGIVIAEQGEFIIPDEFPTTPMVPVAPTVCLIATWENGVVNQSEVKRINGELSSAARQYIPSLPVPLVCTTTT